MLTQSSKVLLPISAVSLAAMVAYIMLTGDHLGIALFAALAIAAAGGTVILAANRDPVTVRLETPPDEPPALRPVAVPRLVGGGAWPVVAALAAALAVTGLVAGPVVGGAAATVGLIAMVGWLATVGTERTGRQPVNLLPFGIPVLGFAFIASLMFLMSRILLAVSEMAATWIALLVAVVILGLASLYALRPQLSTRSMMATLAIGAVLMTGGGLVAAAVGEREIEAHHGAHAEGEAVEISADNLMFDTDHLELHANTEVTISFENEESQPHNVAIYTDDTATEEIFVGDIITGPGTTIEYHFTSPPPGTYFFRCDIHPAMSGTVTVS